MAIRRRTSSTERDQTEELGSGRSSSSKMGVSIKDSSSMITGDRTDGKYFNGTKGRSCSSDQKWKVQRVGQERVAMKTWKRGEGEETRGLAGRTGKSNTATSGKNHLIKLKKKKNLGKSTHKDPTIHLRIEGDSPTNRF